MDELFRIKKTKQYAEELEELDELLTAAILKLKKARILIESIAGGREITKEVVWNTELKNYKVAKLAAIQQEQRQNPSLMDMAYDDENETRVKISKKAPKEKQINDQHKIKRWPCYMMVRLLMKLHKRVNYLKQQFTVILLTSSKLKKLSWKM